MSEDRGTIHLTTLGEVRISGAGEGEEPALRPMVLSLLVYLAAEGVGRVHRRERLLGLFWPEVSDRRARQSLRRHLPLLRKALGQGAVLAPGREELALDPARVSCDAAELTAAWEAGDHARCLELYRGEFAPGLRGPDAHAFEEWLHARRQELLRRAVASGEALADAALGEDRLADAVGHAQRVAALDPLNERAGRRVMELLHRAGDAAAALRRYDALHRLMWQELEVGPSPETVELAERIREGTLDEAPPAEPVRAEEAEDAATDSRGRADGAEGGPARLEPAGASGRGGWRRSARAAAAVVVAAGGVALWVALELPRPGSGPAVARAAGLETVHTGDDDSLDDLLRAMDHYERATEERPLDPEAWAALARTGFTVGRAWPWRTDAVVRARSAVAELERVAPQAGLTLWTRGLAALLDRRDHAEAASLLGAAEEALPGEPRIPTRLGQALLDLGRPGPAGEAFRRAERAGGLTADLAEDQGHALSLLGRHEEARHRLDRARVLAPGSSTIHHAAFRAALRAGDTLRLRELTEGPLPDDGRLRVWGPGHAAYHRGDLRAADSLLARDVRTDHRQRGIVAHLLGDRERAREHGDSLRVRAARALATAEAVDPQALDPVWLSHSHARLGVAFALLERETEARHHAGMARLLLPLDQEPRGGFPPVLMGMQALMILGDTASAAALARTALDRPTPLSRSWLAVDPLLRPVLGELGRR